MKIGIDPGLTGAVALIGDGRILRLWDMPVMEKVHGRGRQVNPYLLADYLREAQEVIGGMAATMQKTVAHVERVSAMPGQGVTSVFGFGHSAGVIDGVLGALQIATLYITPQRWKKHYSLIGKNKDAARTLAIERYPDQLWRFERKMDCGRADAVLIAGYEA